MDLERVAAASERLAKARAEEEAARFALREAVLEAIEAGASEKGIAEFAGVDRMSVRAWQGKRKAYPRR